MQQFKSLAYTKTGLTDGWVINIISLAILLCGVLLPVTGIWLYGHQYKQRMLLYSNQLLNIVRKKIAIKANMVQEYGKNNNTCRNKIEGKYVMDPVGQFPFIV